MDYFYFSLNNFQLASITALMYWIVSRCQVRWIQDLVRTAATILICMKSLDAAYLAFKLHSQIAMAGCCLIGMALMMALISELTGGQRYSSQRIAMGLGFLFITDTVVSAVHAVIALFCSYLVIRSHYSATLLNDPLLKRLTLIFWSGTIFSAYYGIYQERQDEHFDLLSAQILFTQCYKFFGHLPPTCGLHDYRFMVWICRFDKKLWGCFYV